jgi:ribosomal protein S17
MNKTVTVTVSRNVLHSVTGKASSCTSPVYYVLDDVPQQITRTKKFLTHDEDNSVFLLHYYQFL